MHEAMRQTLVTSALFSGGISKAIIGLLTDVTSRLKPLACLVDSDEAAPLEHALRQLVHHIIGVLPAARRMLRVIGCREKLRLIRRTSISIPRQGRPEPARARAHSSPACSHGGTRLQTDVGHR